MKHTLTIALLIVVTAALPACHRDTEEERVKKVISAVQTAAEEKNVKTIMSHVSKTYSDPQGFNYDEIRGLLTAYFLRHPKIAVYTDNLDISLEEPTARVAFRTLLTGGKKTGSITDMLPQSLGMYEFDVSLKKESNAWKVTSAQWTKVGE